RLGEILIRVTLRVPMIEMLYEALTVRLRRVVLRVRRGGSAEQSPPRRSASKGICVVDCVSRFMPNDLQALLGITPFDFEHLGQLQLGQARVRKIEGNRDARNAVGREPLVGQPE